MSEEIIFFFKYDICWTFVKVLIIIWCILIFDCTNTNNPASYIIFHQDWTIINWLRGNYKSITFMAHIKCTCNLKDPRVVKTTIRNCKDKFWTIIFFFDNTNHKRGTCLIIFPFIFHLRTLGFVMLILSAIVTFTFFFDFDCNQPLDFPLLLP